MSLLDAVFVLTLIAAVVSLLFLGMDSILPKVIFGAAVIAGLLVASSSELIAQLRVLRFLDSASHGTPVFVDGKQVQNGDQVLTALKEVRDLPAHHSHPMKKIVVEVGDHGHFLLWVARDSDNPREYWVYYPKHLITRNNEIGRIVTPVFDAY